MSPRRLAALRRMAQQTASPNERAIAEAKLAKADEDDDWRVAWANQQEHERLREEQDRAAREAEYADIVRRWEAGTFSGLTARLGAAGTSTKYGRAA